MSTMENIRDNINKHALECDNLKFSARCDKSGLSKIVYCQCGWEQEITFAAVMASKDGKVLYDGLQIAIDAFNSDTFKRVRIEHFRKQKEQEEKDRRLERRKNAIGSLEV